MCDLVKPCRFLLKQSGLDYILHTRTPPRVTSSTTRVWAFFAIQVDTLNVAIDDGAAISPLREDHLNSSAEDDRRQRSKRSPTRIRRRPHTTKADEKCADRDRRPPDIPRRATATAMFETPPSSAASAIKSSRGESVARAVAGGRHARNSGHNARVFDRERSSEQYWSSSVASECRNAASIHIDSRVAKGNDGKGYRNSHQEECMHDNAPDGGVEERPAATVVDAAADIAMVSQQGRRYIEHTFSAVAPETSAVERLEAKEVSQGGGGLYAVSVRADHGACSTVEPPQSKDEKGGRGSEEAKSGSRIFRAGDGKGGKGKVNGGSAQRSKAKERSEELAKASAATWEQFQHLLKRSRASKKRFDRVMGGSGTSSAPICEKTVVGGRPRLAEKAMDGAARSTDHQPNGAAGHGAVMSRGVVTDSDRSKRASSAIGERSTRARASSEAMIPNSIVNALVSSPERFSSRGSVDAAAAAGATAIWMAELPGAGTDVKADGLESTGVGCGVAGAAVVRDQRGRSGLSTTGVISDAETSLLNLTRDEQPEPRATRRQGGLVFFSDNEDDVNVRSRGTGGVGSGGLYARNDEQTRSPRDKRRGRLSKNATRSPAALSAPVLHAIPATLPPTNTPGAGGGYPRPLAAEDVMHGAAAVRRAPQQQQQTEAVDVQTARRETAKQVERCTALETAAAEAASENDRLKAELATMVTAAAGKRERSLAREKQIAEREKARAEAAAAAADKATRGEMDILKENVEAAERKMESERRESERQREELRRALSAVR